MKQKNTEKTTPGRHRTSWGGENNTKSRPSAATDVKGGEDNYNTWSSGWGTPKATTHGNQQGTCKRQCS